MTRLALLFSFVAVAFALPAAAQCHPGSGFVDLLFNGQDPAMVDPVGHIVPVGIGGGPGADSTLTIEVNDAASASKPFVLITGFGISCGLINLPWGGAVDLASPSVLLDGLNPQSLFDFMAVTDFQFSYVPTCPGVSRALQAVHVEPANPPLMLGTTQAGQAMITPGSVVTVYDAITDDGFQQHTLGGTVCGAATPGATLYAGTVYSSFWVNSNGHVTFGQGSTDFSPTPAEFFAGIQLAPTTTPNPAIAHMYADLNPTAAAVQDDVTVIERISGEVEVQYNNQEHWSSNTAAGSWNIILGAGSMADSVFLDYSSFLPGVPGSDADPIVGVTDGDDTNGGTDTIADLSMGYVSMGIGDSVCEQIGLATGWDLTVYTLVHTGAYSWLGF